MTNNFEIYAPQVHEQGWAPVPLKAESKAPYIPGWTYKNFMNMGEFQDDDLGIKLGARYNHVMMLDFDIDNKTFAKDVRKLLTTYFPELNNTIVVEGTHPHFSIFCRTPQFNMYWPAPHLPAWTDSKGKKCQLEIKYNGRQAGAYVRTKTGANKYGYPRGHDFTNFAPHQLPILTRERFIDLRRFFTTMAEHHGLTPPNKTPTTPKRNKGRSTRPSTPTSAQGLTDRLGTGSPADYIESQLEPLMNEVGHDTILGPNHSNPWKVSDLVRLLSRIPEHFYADNDFWLAFTSAMKNLVKDDPHQTSIILKIWDTVSQTAHNYNQQENYRQWRYRRTEGRLHTLGTIVMVAQLTGNYNSSSYIKRSTQSSVQDFLAQLTLTKATTAEIYQDYTNFCSDNNQEPESSRALLQAIRDTINPTITRPNKKVTIYEVI